MQNASELPEDLESLKSLLEFERLSAIKIKLDSDFGEPIIIIPRLSQIKALPFDVEFQIGLRFPTMLPRNPNYE